MDREHDNVVEFTHDPIVQRPEPDKAILARAQRHMLEVESEMHRYVRQQWDAAIGATRVALDAWRTVVPLEVFDNLPEAEHEVAEEIAHALSHAYLGLDKLSPTMLGEVMYDALHGDVTHEQLDELEIPR